ncbi:MAG: GGDEF domain-containing protein [Oscillospiraceae bacterium]|nr:GGDEF domain-containing protein [Oscillospiraceae bacterium]
MAKKRYTVALFVGCMENEFSEEVFLGAAHTAEQLDVNLVVFPVKFIETIKHNLITEKYQYQYNCMFSYAENHSFDAIVIETAVMGKFVTDNTIFEILQKYKDTPIITIAEKISNYPCVAFSSNGIEQEIDHLVECHHAERIGFVSGPSSNLEAVARYNEYKKALLKHNIPFDQNLVAEGDFTEECGEVISRLLDRNAGEIDAVCFANDSMAIAGYKQIAKRGLVIGKDICVTGFDDIPAASALDPALTTIRANYRELGENAISAAYNAINGIEIHDITVSTTLIKRDSCGCKSQITEDRESLDFLIYNDSDISAFIDKIHDMSSNYCNNTNMQPNKRSINLFLRFILILLMQAQNPDTIIDKNLIMFKFNVLLKYHILDFIPVDNFNFLLSSICDKAISIAKPENKKEDIYKLFMEFYKEIINHNREQNLSDRKIIKKNMYTANSIISNVIENNNESLSLISIIEQFKLNIGNTFLYLHETPVITKSRYDWVQPQYELLTTYYTNKNVYKPGKPKKIQAPYLFRNEYMPPKRFTFIASPIFCSEENYGLLLCDINVDDYLFYGSIIISQISYAIKLRNMLQEQKKVQSKLIESLNEANSNNKLLSHISKSDELTGVYNRRGFIENVVSDIKHHCGRKAAIIYADMDNLKQINDIFGHDEGDYSIRKSAEILKCCMRSNDIIARFGGDEFAAFALIYENNFEELFTERLENLCSTFNAQSDKPYNIHLSAGVYEFICDNNVDLTKVMNEADKRLYENKKHKSLNALKNPEDIHNFKK